MTATATTEPAAEHNTSPRFANNHGRFNNTYIANRNVPQTELILSLIPWPHTEPIEPVLRRISQNSHMHPASHTGPHQPHEPPTMPHSPEPATPATHQPPTSHASCTATPATHAPTSHRHQPPPTKAQPLKHQPSPHQPRQPHEPQTPIIITANNVNCVNNVNKTSITVHRLGRL